MLVNITFEVDTDDPTNTTKIIKDRVYSLMSELLCKNPAQIVTSTAETHKIKGQWAREDTC